MPLLPSPVDRDRSTGRGFTVTVHSPRTGDRHGTVPFILIIGRLRPVHQIRIHGHGTVGCRRSRSVGDLDGAATVASPFRRFGSGQSYYRSASTETPPNSDPTGAARDTGAHPDTTSTVDTTSATVDITTGAVVTTVEMDETGQHQSQNRQTGTAAERAATR